jgi:hypothetical protein
MQSIRRSAGFKAVCVSVRPSTERSETIASRRVFDRADDPPVARLNDRRQRRICNRSAMYTFGITALFDKDATGGWRWKTHSPNPPYEMGTLVVTRGGAVLNRGGSMSDLETLRLIRGRELVNHRTKPAKDTWTTSSLV